MSDSGAEDNDLSLAANIIRGQSATVEDIASLAKRLKGAKQFGYAARLFERARANACGLPPAKRLYFGQQQALCLYKDPHLPADTRYDQALAVLGCVDDLPTTTIQETLGLAGAIYKYKWEAFGQKADLESSGNYYYRGYLAGVATDSGYTGINAAYVSDLLAYQESQSARQTGSTSQTAQQRLQLSTQIRKDLVTTLPALALQKPEVADWWFLVTVAEAYFGLGCDVGARKWILRAIESKPSDWELESTLRQFASIARMRAARSSVDLEKTAAWGVLEAFAGPGAVAGVRGALIGKVGLALSGGGFRAALYHIGVLAKLAELDVLRNVEVLSCVSGGSIIGAHYYLEVRNLLQTKPDADVAREDYIAIVRRIQQQFLEGVQTNIRTRVFANLWVNLKMAFWPHYSRTERVGELFDDKIFSRVQDGLSKRALRDLLIYPKGDVPDFDPEKHNWRRRTKAPILILNATCLNTGHNWQFTASWMGEPPGSIDSEVDGNYRLRRMYYREAPERYRKYRLGYAVAASACVPGIFEPLNLPNLYPDVEVRLVDGGVHDNQGITGLLDEACSVLLVSDASGQMEAEDKPGGAVFGSLLRSNSILQARVRESEHRDLSGRQRSSLLRGLMFIHLKKGLDVEPLDWVGCEDPAPPASSPGQLTAYGIRKDVQEKLSAIRTDLDSFNDTEAYALMTSGYRMTEHEFPRCIRGFPGTAPVTVDWPFLAVEPPMKRIAGLDREHRRLMQLLNAGKSLAFKIWQLSPVLKVIGWIVLAAALAGLVYEAWFGKDVSLITTRWVAVTVIATLAATVVGKTALKIVRFRDTIRQFVISLLLCAVGWLIGGIHLILFDRWYLRRGKIEPAKPANKASIAQGASAG